MINNKIVISEIELTAKLTKMRKKVVKFLFQHSPLRSLLHIYCFVTKLMIVHIYQFKVANSKYFVYHKN